MPNVRCKHFDEKGNLLSKRHANEPRCDFVHPTDPDWKNARASKPRRTEFLSDAWTPDVPTLTSSNTTGLASTGRVWGKSVEDRSRRKSDAQPESSHHSSKNATTSGPSRAEGNPSSSSGSALAPKESGTSWADTLAKAAETGSLSNPWGSSNSNNGWGSGGASWGGVNDTGTSEGTAKVADSGGWGTQSSTANTDRPSVSGSLGDMGKRIGVAREKDIAMRDPSPPPRPPPSTAAAPMPPSISDNRTRRPKRIDFPLLNPEVRSARERTPSFSPAPSTAIISKPLPRPVMPSLSEAAFTESAPNASPGDEDGVSGMPQADTPASFTKSYKGYEGRAALFSEVVSQLQEAVVFEIVLLRAQAEAMRWKKTQSSEIYAHPTQKARIILDGHRAQYHDKISAAKSARDRALSHLGALPELPTRAEQLAGPKLEIEKIQAYTEELKEWLEGLERHRSLLKAKQEAEQAQLDPLHSEPVSGIPTQPQLQSLQSLLRREKWSWKELKVAPSLINLAIEDAQAVIYGEDYTRIDELCFDDLKALDEQISPVAADEGTPDGPDGESQLLVTRIETNGKSLEAQVSRAAKLLHEIATLKEKIKEVKEQREKMDEICAEAEKQFSEFDSNKEADSAKIRELTGQLQNLSLHRRPAAEPTTALSQVKIDELLEYIRPIIVERVKEDLTKVVQGLAMRCRENQDLMADEIDKLLKPVLDSTEQIRQNSLSMSAKSASQSATVSDTTVL